MTIKRARLFHQPASRARCGAHSCCSLQFEWAATTPIKP